MYKTYCWLIRKPDRIPLGCSSETWNQCKVCKNRTVYKYFNTLVSIVIDFSVYLWLEINWRAYLCATPCRYFHSRSTFTCEKNKWIENDVRQWTCHCYSNKQVHIFISVIIISWDNDKSCQVNVQYKITTIYRSSKHIKKHSLKTLYYLMHAEKSS